MRKKYLTKVTKHLDLLYFQDFRDSRVTVNDSEISSATQLELDEIDLINDPGQDFNALLQIIIGAADTIEWVGNHHDQEVYVFRKCHDGMAYRVLAIPDHETQTLEVFALYGKALLG